jgi:hypothetical protein
MALEGFRRGTIGGSLLSLFIIKEFGLEGQARPTLDFLRWELSFEEKVIDEIPPPLFFIASPFIDYHEAAKYALQAFDILASEEAPHTTGRKEVNSDQESYPPTNYENVPDMRAELHHPKKRTSSHLR